MIYFNYETDFEALIVVIVPSLKIIAWLSYDKTWIAFCTDVEGRLKNRGGDYRKCSFGST